MIEHSVAAGRAQLGCGLRHISRSQPLLGGVRLALSILGRPGNFSKPAAVPAKAMMHLLRSLAWVGAIACFALSAQLTAGQSRAAQDTHRQMHKPEKATANQDASTQSTPALNTSSPTAIATPEPASLFDALGVPGDPVRITVVVHAKLQDLNTTQTLPFLAGGEEIISSAGTYGGIARYLQTSPGVATNSDVTNEFFVRGGHPVENLFIVDGIEMPNINSLATLGTTGGFGSMIDIGAVQRISLLTGGFDAHYSERLSSVTEITTLEPQLDHLEGDVGIQGFGGLAVRKLRGGNLLLSAHHGIVHALAGDFGARLPSYDNALAHFRRSDASGNGITLLNIAGMDALDIVPCGKDMAETSTIESHYRGWRNTAGMEWQRVYSRASFGLITLSDSEQVEHINQDDQLIDPLHLPKYGRNDNCRTSVPGLVVTPVYQDRSNDAFTTAAYRYEYSTGRLSLDAGTSGQLDRPHFAISQPMGIALPYSADLKRSDATSFSSHFATGETGSFAQVAVHPWKPLAISGGMRLQTFAFGSHATMTPRASARYWINQSLALQVAYAQYAQLPPYVYLLSFPENRSMIPMRATHEIAGLDWSPGPKASLRVEVFDKIYTDVPASTEYPSVTFHNLAIAPTDQVVWLRMNSNGRGRSSGMEISDTSHFGARLDIRGSIAYSRAKFSGLDEVMRPSNFDFPWIVNLASHQTLGRGYEVSTRYTYTSGRPYTPYDMSNSRNQNRPIYDVTRMNAVRGRYYSRLDAQIDKDLLLGGRHLVFYGGVQNILNRSNFLSYAWEPRNRKSPVAEVDQTPIFPNFGVRFIVH